jgi:hypothetical protein
VSPAIEGAAEWEPEIVPAAHEWQLRWRCPTCRMSDSANVQPLPWQVPTDDGLEDVDEITTEVWCHRCGHGTDVTVTQE